MTSTTGSHRNKRLTRPPPQHLLHLQEKVLVTFGMLEVNNSYSRIFRGFGFVLLTGGWFMVALQTADFAIRIKIVGSTTPSRVGTQLISFIQDLLLYLTAMLRGILLLTVTLTYPLNLRQFLQGLARFRTSWSKFRPIEATQERRWRRKAVALFLLYWLALSCWEVGSWSIDIAKYSTLTPEGLLSYAQFPSFPNVMGDQILNWHYAILWELFITLPLFISLQFSVCVATAAGLLRDGVALLLEQLQVGSHARAIATFSSATATVKKPLAFISEGIEKDSEVTRLVKFYEAIADYNVCLNDTIGVTFWMLYWIDLFSVMTYIAFFISLAEVGVSELVEVANGMATHLLYLLSITLPVASAFEQVQTHLTERNS